MKKIRLLSLFATCVAMSLTVVSCKEAAEEVKLPEVTLSKGEATPTSLTFTVEPVNAVKCAWGYVIDGNELPQANHIISNGTEAPAETVSTITVPELEPSTRYTIIVAVSGRDGTVVSAKLDMTTLEDTAGPEPDPDTPYEMTFSDVVCDNQYADPGEFYIVMKDAKGEHDLKLDFFAAEDAAALPAGTYTIGNGEEPNTLNDGYTFLNIKPVGATSTTVVMFKDGTVEVKKDGQKYVLDINLVAAEDGKIYKSHYEGEIKNMPVEPSETVDVTMSAASLHPNSEPENGYFLVKMNNEAWTHEMSLQFYAAAGSGILPDGVYTVSDSKTPGTIGMGSCLDIKNKGSNYFKSGTVTVTKSGGNYKVETSLIGRDDNRLYKVAFEGKIKGMEDEEQKIIELVATSAILFNSDQEKGQFYVKFNDANWSFDMAIDFYAVAGSAALPAGTYSVEDGSIGSKSYVELYQSSVTARHDLSAGTIEVSKEDNVYAVSMNLTSKIESTLLKITFTGEIKDMPSEPSEPENVYNFVMNAAKFHFNSKPNEGYFIVKMNDDSWTHEMSLHFYAEAGSGILPEGTYTYADTNAPGTIGINSSLDIQNKGSNYFKAGKVIVTKNGDTYKFDMNLTGRDDDRIFKGTFEGKIGDMQ